MMLLESKTITRDNKLDNKFVFLTPAYNCREEMRQTLFSMFAQSYQNWRAVIIDDVSNDGTGEFVLDLAKKHGYEDRITVKIRKEKHGETKNTLTEIKEIEDNEIVCRVDGGDWITENDSLFIINEVYKKYDPAVLWTAHRWAFTDTNISGQLNLSQQHPNVYTHPWVSSHMKTFRAEKLKRVPESNFKDEDGNWIMIACDQAVFLPMMHLAMQNKESLIFLPRVCYHYSIDLKKPDLFHNDRSYAQKHSAEWIRQRGFVA
jgi:glycosyltransferase involved in cell wall biosynthesis